MQGAVFCFANIFAQASVDHFGETVIAGSTIAMNFEYFTYYIITAFGQTATTFTSQNYAARQQDRCRRVLWLCLGVSTVCSAIPIFMIVRFRGVFSALFTQEAAVIESAAVRILCILLFEPLCNLYEVPAGVPARQRTRAVSCGQHNARSASSGSARCSARIRRSRCCTMRSRTRGPRRLCW